MEPLTEEPTNPQTESSPEKAQTRSTKSMNELIPIVEGALFAANGPLSAQDIAKIFDEEEKPALAEIRKAMELLQKGYEKRGIRLVEVASGFRFQVADHVAPYIAKSVEERPARYSRALLETLALIAYRQPITRGEIEDIRGVVVSTNIIKTLDEQEWIRIVGYKDVPGKPALYATTKAFLDHFGLKSLDELPPLSELKPIETIDLADEASMDMPDMVASNEEAEPLTEEEAQAQAAAIANAAIEAAMNAVEAQNQEDDDTDIDEDDDFGEDIEEFDEDINDDDEEEDEDDQDDDEEDDEEDDDEDDDEEDDDDDEIDDDEEDFGATEDDFDFSTEELDDIEDKSELKEEALLEEDEEEPESLSSILDELENSDRE